MIRITESTSFEITMPRRVAETPTKFHLTHVGFREVIEYMVRDLDVEMSVQGTSVTIKARARGPAASIMGGRV
jgi:hypothetical protein